MAECIHLIEETTCTLCNGRDKHEAQAARTVAYDFLAKYDGKCMECGGWFTTGTKVSCMQNGDLRHANCTVRRR